MPKLLRKLGKRLRVGGKLARSGCTDRCCGAFYKAIICEPVAGAPSLILIRKPFRCQGETCELNGGRIVIYSGQCYRVVEIPNTYQEPPCDDRLLAETVRLSDFPPDDQPPVVTVSCKPLESTCDDPTCVPPGECCIVNTQPVSCDQVPVENRPCTPCNDAGECECGDTYYLSMRWNTIDRSFAPSFYGGELLEELLSSGTFSVLYECNQNGATRITVTDFSPNVRYRRGPGFATVCGTPSPPVYGTVQEDYDAAVEGLYQFLRQTVVFCGLDPSNLIDQITSMYLYHNDCAGARHYPPLHAIGGPCSTSSNDGFLSVSGSLSLTCGGGYESWVVTDSEQSPTLLRGQHQGEILWTFGTEIACPGGGQIVDQQPQARRSIPLTPDIERAIVERFGV